MASNDVLIRLTDVSKYFGKVKALNDLSMEVESGIFGLVGPNGAGKTTLLRILLGLIKPNKGEAEVLGRNVADGPEKFMKYVGVLHEHPFYPPLLTPHEYLEAVALLYPESKSSSELLSMVELSDASDRRIKNLSAGMYRRLGLAQALVGNPKLVLLDEPTSNLDVKGRDLVVKLILKISKEDGVSFFITSHILSELERICDEIGIIDSGHLLEKGSLKELVEKHTKNRFRIITSDSTELEKLLREESDVDDTFIEGSATLIVEVSPSFADNIDMKLQQLIQDSNLKIFEVRRSGTLEDAIRRAVSYE